MRRVRGLAASQLTCLGSNLHEICDAMAVERYGRKQN